MIKELTNDEYNNYISTLENVSLFQLPEYAFTMNKEGYTALFLGLIENNQVIGATLLLVKEYMTVKVAYAPRGFILDYMNADLVSKFTKEIKKYLKRVNICAVKLNPLIIKKITDADNKVIYENSNYQLIGNVLSKLGYQHLGYNDFFESFKPRFEAVVNLGKSDAELFSNIKKNFRTKIRGAESDGIRIYRGNVDNLEYLYSQTKGKYPRDLSYFKELYNNFIKTNGIDFYYAKLDTGLYLQNARKCFETNQNLNFHLNEELMNNKKVNKDSLINEKMNSDVKLEKYKNSMILATKLLKDYPDGLILASALVVKCKKTAYLVMDGFDPKYKNINAKHILLWSLISNYNKLGYKEFNFGGVINPLKSHPKYNGLREFKNNFDANTIEYMGDIELVANNLKYILFNNKK